MGCVTQAFFPAHQRDPPPLPRSKWLQWTAAPLKSAVASVLSVCPLASPRLLPPISKRFLFCHTTPSSAPTTELFFPIPSLKTGCRSNKTLRLVLAVCPPEPIKAEARVLRFISRRRTPPPTRRNVPCQSFSGTPTDLRPLSRAKKKPPQGPGKSHRRFSLASRQISAISFWDETPKSLNSSLAEPFVSQSLVKPLSYSLPSSALRCRNSHHPSTSRHRSSPHALPNHRLC